MTLTTLMQYLHQAPMDDCLYHSALFRQWQGKLHHFVLHLPIIMHSYLLITRLKLTGEVNHLIKWPYLLPTAPPPAPSHLLSPCSQTLACHNLFQSESLPSYPCNNNTLNVLIFHPPLMQNWIWPQPPKLNCSSLP